jgi:hypothetical protein
VAFVYVLAQLLSVAHASYGYLQDEFYYLSCAMRPALGYVDHPPFAPWVLAVTRTFLGESLLGIRLLPALSGGAVVFLAGLLARRFGAGFWGQLTAALCVLTTPMVLLFGSFFSTNCFSILFWTIACYLLTRLIQTGDTRWWLPLGLVSGIALLNKHAYATLLILLFVGMIATPLRRHFLERRLWIAVGITGLCLLPNLLWQAMNGWPAAEFYQYVAQRDAKFGPLQVVVEQIMGTGASFLIWVPGLLFFLRSMRGRAYRIFGVMYLIALAILMILGSSRSDRIMGLYPVLFAGGATLLEEHARRSRPVCLAFAASVVAAVSVAIAALPLVLPVLSPARLVTYPLWDVETDIKRGDVYGGGPIPVPLAYRRGWDRLLTEMARVYQDLGAERSEAVLLASDLGQAGALEILGRDYGLPAVYSPHVTFALWAQEEAVGSPPIVIAVGFAQSELDEHFRSVERVAAHDCRYCIWWRNGTPIYVAREPRRKLREIVAQLENFGEIPWRAVMRAKMAGPVEEGGGAPGEAPSSSNSGR